MIKADSYFKENLEKIRKDGYLDENPRPKYADGTPAYTKFITQVFEEYDLQKREFPIPTLRNTAIKTGIREILWIYQKQSNELKEAHRMGVNWWDEWNVGDNTIGQRYGATVLRYDLIDRLLDGLERDPFGRRHIMNLYQETDLNETKGLYPCAYETIWSVRKEFDVYYLDMTLIQRSQDYLMASAINKIQYCALMLMIVGHLNSLGKERYKIGKFCHFVQNLHIYDRHFDAMNELLLREPLDVQPMLFLQGSKNFYKYTIDDFIITGTENIKKIESPLEIAI